MRRLISASLLLLALGAGSASADTFAVVPDRFVAVPDGQVALPSAEQPNQSGAICSRPAPGRRPSCPSALSYEELQALWLHAGVLRDPWQVLAAINKIESNFGRNMGPSSAGAVGWMQFMPDTWLRWGLDGNGDGIADPWNPDDAISAARYLAAANGRTDIARAIFAYNHAQWYVDDVLQLAALSAATSRAPTSSSRSTGWRSPWSRRRSRWPCSPSSSRRPRRPRLKRRGRAADDAAEDLEQLVSERVLAEKDAFQAGQELTAATAETDRLRTELAQAQIALETAQSGAAAASFAPAAAGSCGCRRERTATSSRSGRPGAVSVGRLHHDYPAADIAAPLGAPLYALADGIVLSVVDDGRCGTGFVLQTLDGLEWVYCHLSYARPGLEAWWSAPASGSASSAPPATPRGRTCTSASGRRAIRRRCPGSRSSPGSPSRGRRPPRHPLDAGVRARAAGGARGGRRRIHTLGGLSSCPHLPKDAV